MGEDLRSLGTSFFGPLSESGIQNSVCESIASRNGFRPPPVEAGGFSIIIGKIMHHASI